ncbi:MAG: glycosyltransferase family 4 protein [Candidatus Harrisonbacteria bacterium]|nr:glycosyltransferase family 4 protein [Candidatus Harrisonbacteria bacterium]
MRILFFTQKIDKDDDVLGYTYYLVQAFSKQFSQITVISLFPSSETLPINVRLFSLRKSGERGLFSKLQAFFRFFQLIIQERKNYDAIFVHMNEIYAALGGWFFRLTHKPVFLWKTSCYKPGLLLRFSTFFLQGVFTSTRETFQLQSAPIYPVGHGIQTELFSSPSEKKRDTLLFLGRITHVKKIENIITGYYASHATELLQIIGEAKSETDRKYLSSLKEKISVGNNEKEVLFLGAKPYNAIPFYFQKAEILFNFTPKGSFDKSVLEAMAAGCLVLTSNPSFLPLIPKKWQGYLFIKNNEKADQVGKAIDTLLSLKEIEKEEMRKYFRELVVREHSVEHLAEAIYEVMFNFS